jgi:phosphate starvation-inducible PhoH-like protein
VDLPPGQKSGLAEALSLLEGVEGIAISRFAERDVVRHPLVAKIVAAYGRFDDQVQDRARSKRERDGTGK